MIQFVFKLLTEEKDSWTVHYGLYHTLEHSIFECDRLGVIVDGVSFSSVWEFVRLRHWEMKGQSIMPMIFLYGRSAASFMSLGILLSLCHMRFFWPRVPESFSPSAGYLSPGAKFVKLAIPESVISAPPSLPVESFRGLPFVEWIPKAAPYGAAASGGRAKVTSRAGGGTNHARKQLAGPARKLSAFPVSPVGVISSAPGGGSGKNRARDPPPSAKSGKNRARDPPPSGEPGSASEVVWKIELIRGDLRRGTAHFLDLARWSMAAVRGQEDVRGIRSFVEALVPHINEHLPGSFELPAPPVDSPEELAAKAEARAALSRARAAEAPVDPHARIKAFVENAGPAELAECQARVEARVAAFNFPAPASVRADPHAIIKAFVGKVGPAELVKFKARVEARVADYFSAQDPGPAPAQDPVPAPVQVPAPAQDPVQAPAQDPAPAPVPDAPAVVKTKPFTGQPAIKSVQPRAALSDRPGTRFLPSAGRASVRAAEREGLRVYRVKEGVVLAPPPLSLRHAGKTRGFVIHVSDASGPHKQLVIPASAGLSTPLDKRPRVIEADHALIKPEPVGLSTPLDKRPRVIEADHALIKPEPEGEGGVKKEQEEDDQFYIWELRGSGKRRRVLRPNLQKDDPEAYNALMNRINPGYTGHVRVYF